MAVIETETFHEAWDCDECGLEGLSAYNCKQCPTCGAPLDEESVYPTFKPVENYQFKGNDITCSHCQTRNEKRFSCRNCGASLTDGDDKRVEAFTYKTDADGRPKKDKPASASTRKETLTEPTTPSTTASSDLHLQKWWYVGGGALVLLIGLAWWLITQLTAVIPVTLTAERAHWAYYLSLEDYAPRARDMTVEDGSFGSPPSDAYDIDRRHVFIRTEPIYQSQTVSQTCTGTSSQSNGDGTWTQTTYTYDCSYSVQVQVGTDDIWGTRYDYTIDRWESISPLTKEGWGQQPDFPSFRPSAQCQSVYPGYGCVRAVGEPQLTFTIHFFHYVEGDEERHDVTRTMTRTIWESFRLGADYPAVLNGFGEIRAIAGIDSNYAELMGK